MSASTKNKMQFLDPIATGCKLILIKFSEPHTKIRITNHTVQLVPHTYSERLILRPWVYNDSRDDICILYPAILRFVELFLMRNSLNTHENYEINETKEEVENINYSSECYEYLKLLGNFMIEGLIELQKTYIHDSVDGFDNAVLTLQLYINMLDAGIKGTYTRDIIPQNLNALSENSLLDNNKIKSLWDEEHIKSVGRMFCDCFDAYEKKLPDMVDNHKCGIINLLKKRDNEFRKIIKYTKSF